MKHIDSEKFKCDISNKLHLSALATFGENITMYNEVLQEALNIHAPIKTRSIKLVQKAPWFDGEYSHLRRLCRKAEQRYRKSGLVVHKEEYIRLREQTTALAHIKKCRYYGDKLEGANKKSCIQLSISY